MFEAVMPGQLLFRKGCKVGDGLKMAKLDYGHQRAKKAFGAILHSDLIYICFFCKDGSWEKIIFHLFVLKEDCIIPMC